MRVRLSCLVLGLLLVPTLAHADDHFADVLIGISFGTGGSKLTGFHGAFAKEVHDPILFGNVAGVADVSIQWGTNVTQVVYMGGPRVTLGRNESRVKGHLQFLMGGVYTDNPVISGNDFAVAGSAALEYVLTGLSGTRTEFDRGWALRGQTDVIRRFGDHADTFPRYSLNAVYLFPR